MIYLMLSLDLCFDHIWIIRFRPAKFAIWDLTSD